MMMSAEGFSGEIYQVKDCECGERIISVGGWDDVKAALCPKIDQSNPLWWASPGREHMSYTVVEQGFTAEPIDAPARRAASMAALDKAIKEAGLDKMLRETIAGTQ